MYWIQRRQAMEKVSGESPPSRNGPGKSLNESRDHVGVTGMCRLATLLHEQ
jgi:hypothetical protein